MKRKTRQYFVWTVKAFQNKLSLILNQIEEFDFSHLERSAT